LAEKEGKKKKGGGETPAQSSKGGVRSNEKKNKIQIEGNEATLASIWKGEKGKKGKNGKKGKDLIFVEKTSGKRGFSSLQRKGGGVQTGQSRGGKRSPLFYFVGPIRKGKGER